MNDKERSELKRRLVAAIAANDQKAIVKIKRELRGEIKVLRTFLDFLIVTDSIDDGSGEKESIYEVDPNGEFPRFIQQTENSKSKSNE